MEWLDFYDTGEPINEFDIAKFEERFEIKFPEDYKRLLLKYNGGIPKEDVVFVNGEEGSIGGFYSLTGDSALLESAIHDYQITEKLIPREFIPIAFDAFGNPYCISVAKESYGEIYTWYFDVGETEGVFTSPSLERFLRKDD